MEIQEKTVNLLYTSWDGDTPKPNGYDLDYTEICDSPHYFDFQGFIDVYLNNNTLVNDNRKILVNKCRLEDVKDDEIYFYVICHANLTLKDLVDYKFPVHEKVINLLRQNKNIKVIFCKEHEPECRFGVEKLSEQIKNLNLNEENFFLLNNNLNTKKQLENISSSINSFKLNFIEYSSSEVLTNLKHEMSFDREYIFLCRNKKPKFHRLCTLLYLYHSGISYNTNWSLITSDEMDRKSMVHYLKLFDFSELNHMIPSIKFINSIFKYDVYENPKWFDANGDFQHQGDFDSVFLIPEELKSYKNAYVNIITESNFENIDNIVHPTEKSFRPFYHYQIPIFISTPHHIKYLRDKYGFDMFDDLVDHSYDSIENDKDRFKFITSQINKLNEKGKIFLYQYFRKNKHRFENNKKILLEKFKENRILDLDYFWNLI